METPENYPEIIYKYRNWTNEYHKNLIYKNQLYMSSPEYFNDPFDCRIPSSYMSLDSPEKIEAYVDSFISRHKDFLIGKGLNLRQEKMIMIKKFEQNLNQIQLNHEQTLFESQNKHLGVLSLSARWDSILMWSHYGDFHKGYCVGFYEEKLRNSNLFGKGGPISYNPENIIPTVEPGDHSIEKGFLQTHTKSYDWKYEEEYRLVKMFFPNVATEDDRTKVVKDECFAEVIIGLLTPEKAKKEIIKAAREKGLKVYQAKKVPFKFELGREEILP